MPPVHAEDLLQRTPGRPESRVRTEERLEMSPMVFNGSAAGPGASAYCALTIVCSLLSVVLRGVSYDGTSTAVETPSSVRQRSVPQDTAQEGAPRVATNSDDGAVSHLESRTAPSP
ncbi:hypothetical protein Scel_57220 [Streptomyces cellostaticus]|nr:hypothetical protein Scel_57220 [Streptomyces cellostaticus]